MSITDEIVKNAQATNDNGAEILTFQHNDRLPYRAFEVNPTRDMVLCLGIYAKKMNLICGYDQLEHVLFTGLGDFVGLIFRRMTVKLFGRNLQGLTDGLKTHSVEWVCEYAPPVWEYADGENGMLLPCIEKIVIENEPFNPIKEALQWQKEREGQE